MSNLVFSIDGNSYRRAKRQFLRLLPEALNPYGTSQYRVVRCKKIYRKNQPPLYSFTVLAIDNRLLCIKVFESDETVKVFREIRDRLKNKIPAIVNFDWIDAVTYNLPSGSTGISLYSLSCECIKNSNQLDLHVPYYLDDIIETKED